MSVIKATYPVEEMMSLALESLEAAGAGVGDIFVRIRHVEHIGEAKYWLKRAIEQSKRVREQEEEP